MKRPKVVRLKYRMFGGARILSKPKVSAKRLLNDIKQVVIETVGKAFYFHPEDLIKLLEFKEQKKLEFEKKYGLKSTISHEKGNRTQTQADR